MINKVIDYLRNNNLQSMFFYDIYNVRHISGYTSSDAYVFVTLEECYFITDPRYTEQAQNECKNFTIVNWRDMGNSIGQAVALIAKKHNITQIGFEGSMKYSTYSAMKSSLKAVELIETNGIVEKLREIKTPYEIECQKEACKISCRAFDKILNDIKEGVTEKEIAARLCFYMVMEGADSQPYGDIVISGSNTSLMHGIPSDKKIQKGDFVLMDYGCAYKGFLSDMTRTVVLGRATEEQKQIYSLEKQMVEDCLAVMKAGVKGKDIFSASLKAVENTKYKQYIYNGIGHVIGRYVHEDIFISPTCERTLEENMVTTIEPGIYIPGFGGVRIEDQVLITKNGYENMVTVTRNLIEI